MRRIIHSEGLLGWDLPRTYPGPWTKERDINGWSIGLRVCWYGIIGTGVQIKSTGYTADSPYMTSIVVQNGARCSHVLWRRCINLLYFRVIDKNINGAPWCADMSVQNACCVYTCSPLGLYFGLLWVLEEIQIQELLGSVILFRKWWSKNVRDLWQSDDSTKLVSLENGK